MSFIGDLTGLGGVADAAQSAIKSITDLIEKFIPDPNLKLQMQTEAKQLLAQSQQEQYDAMSKVMVADSSSDSAYTRNARPTVVYWSLGMITLLTGASLVGYSDPMLHALAQVPDNLYQMITYGVGIYTGGRSLEKVGTVLAKAIAKR